MAEPVRKCAGCRMRVQTVQRMDDGLSYCPRCIARMQDAVDVAAGETPAPEADAQEAPPPDTSSPSEEPRRVEAVEQVTPVETPPAAPEGGPVTPTTGTETAPPPAAIAAPAPQPQEESNGHAQQHLDRPPAIVGAGASDVLVQALRAERAALLEHREALEEELRDVERGMQAIGRRLDHVQALLDEPLVTDGGTGKEAGAA